MSLHIWSGAVGKSLPVVCECTDGQHKPKDCIAVASDFGEMALNKLRWLVSAFDTNEVEMVREFILAKNATHKPDEWRTFLREEWEELQNAFDAGDMVEILDAICDLKYELNGLGIVLGMDVAGAYHEVHRSNMTKDPGDGTHKIRKGQGRFSPPILHRFINPEHMPMSSEIEKFFVDREREEKVAAEWQASGVDIQPSN
jgi:hypothetical protein